MSLWGSVLKVEDAGASLSLLPEAEATLGVAAGVATSDHDEDPHVANREATGRRPFSDNTEPLYEPHC